jgi:hypothetical protein
MRQVLSDALISVFAVAILLVLLVSVDPRVREQVGTTLGNPSTSTITTVSRHMRDVSNSVMTAAEAHSLANAPMAVFGVVAAVLVFFMLRT